MNKIEKITSEIEATRNSLSTDRLDMSFGEIINMYESKELIISPEFQRLFRWNNYQQTRFIESILIGIPVPPLFIAEDKDGKWEIVDGLQRTSTVISFFGLLNGMEDKNNWKMCEGEMIKDLNGVSIKELPLKFQLNIKRASCRIEIIKWNSKFDMRYELFNRLNTGGASLTDQEIRNAIFRGAGLEFNDFLRSCSSNREFIDIIKPTKHQSETLYMDELVLRFCSLYDDKKGISENISQHMTNYMKEAVKNPNKINELEIVFNNTIHSLRDFGHDVFRGSNGVFSSSLYDAIMIGVAKNIDKYKSNSKLLENKIKELKKSKEFKESSGTASKSRVIKRIKAAQIVFG